MLPALYAKISILMDGLIQQVIFFEMFGGRKVNISGNLFFHDGQIDVMTVIEKLFIHFASTGYPILFFRMGSNVIIERFESESG